MLLLRVQAEESGKPLLLSSLKGIHIVLNGRDAQRLQETENEIKNIHGNVISVCSDVSTIAGGQLLIDECIKAFGRIDFLINNVGVSMRGDVADLNPEVLNWFLKAMSLELYILLFLLSNICAKQKAVLFLFPA